MCAVPIAGTPSQACVCCATAHEHLALAAAALRVRTSSLQGEPSFGAPCDRSIALRCSLSSHCDRCNSSKGNALAPGGLSKREPLCGRALLLGLALAIPCLPQRASAIDGLVVDGGLLLVAQKLDALGRAARGSWRTPALHRGQFNLPCPFYTGAHPEPSSQDACGLHLLQPRHRRRGRSGAGAAGPGSASCRLAVRFPLAPCMLSFSLDWRPSHCSRQLPGAHLRDA